MYKYFCITLYGSASRLSMLRLTRAGTAQAAGYWSWQCIRCKARPVLRELGVVPPSSLGGC